MRYWKQWRVGLFDIFYKLNFCFPPTSVRMAFVHVPSREIFALSISAVRDWFLMMFFVRCQQSCINTEGSFYCSCHDGFELNKNGLSCIDVDECVENNGDCSNICINLIGGHSCACEAGFMLGNDNKTCYDVDECQEINDCSHICINTEGTYECACPRGFILGHDKFNCHDIDECLDSPCIHGHCNNTLGSFHCQCSHGYELSEDRVSCVDVDECSHHLHRHTCSHHCMNYAGGWDEMLNINPTWIQILDLFYIQLQLLMSRRNETERWFTDMPGCRRMWNRFTLLAYLWERWKEVCCLMRWKAIQL